MNWYKLRKENGRAVACLKVYTEPTPKGVCIASERIEEQTTREFVAVDGVIVYDKLAHHGQGRNAAYVFASSKM